MSNVDCMWCVSQLDSLRRVVDRDVGVERVAQAVLCDGGLQLADVVGLRVAAAHRVEELQLHLSQQNHTPLSTGPTVLVASTQIYSEANETYGQYKIHILRWFDFVGKIVRHFSERIISRVRQFHEKQFQFLFVLNVSHPGMEEKDKN